jgi:putative sigma-54 modulation protein
MNWLLKDQVADRIGPQGSRRPADLPEHIERRLRFALARFGNRVERVVVFLQDRNGPKGGIDKVCRILAKVQGCGSVMAAVADADWTAAVDRATTRIGHTVARQVDRLRDRSGRSPRSAVRGLRPSFGR